MQHSDAKPGLFLTFEGTEGVGKSTQLQHAAQWLRRHDVDVIVTREPGGTPMAESIRDVLLSAREEKVDEVTELLLMFAARSQHLNTLIRPALAAGKWVLCDRFTDATYAYQGGGRGVGDQKIAMLEQLVQADFRPDHVILLDAPVETGMARARQRGELDRFEREAVDFFDRVRQVYRARAARHPHQYHLLDATASAGQVAEGLADVLEAILLEFNRQPSANL